MVWYSCSLHFFSIKTLERMFIKWDASSIFKFRKQTSKETLTEYHLSLTSVSTPSHHLHQNSNGGRMCQEGMEVSSHRKLNWGYSSCVYQLFRDSFKEFYVPSQNMFKLNLLKKQNNTWRTWFQRSPFYRNCDFNSMLYNLHKVELPE